jgi:FixJ family two-component response regulator
MTAPGIPSTQPAGRDATVIVVDDDASVRTALARLLRADGYAVEVYASAAEMLARQTGDAPTCLVLDLRMPDVDGLALQDRLRAGGHDPAIVFLSGHGDVATTARAMKAGAVDFLEKPFESSALLEAVERALARDRTARAIRRERARLAERYAKLTAREREVLALVVAGLLNKMIAERLGASEKTIKVHRGRVMLKMRAASVPELVRMATTLGVAPDCAMSE